MCQFSFLHVYKIKYHIQNVYRSENMFKTFQQDYQENNKNIPRENYYKNTLIFFSHREFTTVSFLIWLMTVLKEEEETIASHDLLNFI